MLALPAGAFPTPSLAVHSLRGVGSSGLPHLVWWWVKVSLHPLTTLAACGWDPLCGAQAHLLTVASRDLADFATAVVASGFRGVEHQGTWVAAARGGSAGGNAWSWVDGTPAGVCVLAHSSCMWCRRAVVCFARWSLSPFPVSLWYFLLVGA
jgi:hypothetical protein